MIQSRNRAENHLVHLGLSLAVREFFLIPIGGPPVVFGEESRWSGKRRPKGPRGRRLEASRASRSNAEALTPWGS